jgi:protein SCO1/2
VIVWLANLMRDGAARTVRGGGVIAPLGARLGAWLVACVMLTGVAFGPAGGRTGATPVGQGGIANELPDEVKGLEVKERLGQKIDLDMVFTNSDGKPVQLREFFANGKPVVMKLVYFRCPMQCPLILQRFNQRLREMDFTIGTEFNVVIVSFDPTETADRAMSEKTAAMLNYGRGPEETVAAHWGWLTSQTPGQAQRLAEQLGYPYRYLPASNEYAHPAVGFVLAPDGMISRYLYGIDTPVRDLRLALLEASEGKIGNTLDRVMMFCFHFDPNSGGYVASAWRIMQLSSVGMVLFVLGIIMVMLVVEWRRRAAHAAARLARAGVGAGVGTGVEAGAVSVIKTGVAAGGTRPMGVA